MRQSNKKPVRRRRGPGFWGGLLMGLCICAIAVPGYLMTMQMLEYKTGEDAYGELARGFGGQRTAGPSGEAIPGGTDLATAPPGGWPDVDFQALARANPDVAGWLIVPDTEINYPVVNAPDNEYYLKRLFNQRKNDAGTLFIDARNRRGFQDANTVIYGHNMKNGTMFAAITRYKDQRYYDGHPRAYLLTTEGKFVIELFAGFVSSIKDDSWQRTFADDGEHARWIARMREKSTFETTVQPDAATQTVTLSTCSYEYDDARYVVMGTLTRVQ